MKPRKLRHRVKAERDALERRLADTLDEWQRAWMLDGVALEHRVIDLRADLAAEAVQWQLLGSDETGAPAVCYRMSDAPQALAARWLGLPLSGVRIPHASREPLADALSRRGCEALFEAFAAATHCTRSENSTLDDDGARLMHPWSGAVAMRTAGLGLTADWLLSCATVDRLLPRRVAAAPRAREALTPVTQALAARKFRATVELESVALSVGDLGVLRPGDVLALGHRLDTPLNILTSSDNRKAAEKLFGGFLVAHDGRKSVKLITEAPANPS